MFGKYKGGIISLINLTLTVENWSERLDIIHGQDQLIMLYFPFLSFGIPNDKQYQ